MRCALVLIVALLCGGCFVIDEIEAGQEIMQAHSPNEEPEPEHGTAGTQSGPKSARQRLAEYYAKQRAKAARAMSRSDDPADDVGKCRIRGTTYLLRRSDCQVRGGAFL